MTTSPIPHPPPGRQAAPRPPATRPSPVARTAGEEVFCAAVFGDSRGELIRRGREQAEAFFGCGVVLRNAKSAHARSSDKYRYRGESWWMPQEAHRG
ncbi:MAG: hypothetical protein QM708_12130 [Propioniciclava sp.]|uniref:hypothetical protein n=1 Tax=Propioniciclava sp. TaxID=2038686 RepID=UPI0039E2140B